VFYFQSRPTVIAWLLIPLGFGVFIAGAYSVALALGTLPFLKARESIWWLAVAAGLLAGSRLLVRNRSRPKTLWTVGLVLIYLVVMSVVFASTTLVIACKFGDCL
jgi:hypothetical protein